MKHLFTIFILLMFFAVSTSTAQINWTKDPANPVLPQGEEGEWDETGVWDPYVIYEDGLFKMWYGGGGGRKPNFG